MTFRDLGTMGENTFSLWCANSGLIANYSRIDKTGWDFYLEDSTHLPISTLEIHLPSLEFKVQVKATDNTKRKVQIPLSNLRRLATTLTPVFFMFIEFDGSTSAQRAYLRHLDKDLITQILKRSHNNSLSSKPKKENKTSMTIHYNESHRIPDISKPFLKEALIQHTGTNLATYSAIKKQHLESTGFETGSTSFTFSTQGLKNLSDLIDASLGIPKKVNISNVNATHKRFNTLSSTPFLKSDTAIIEFIDVKHSHEGTISLIHDPLSTGIQFDCKLFTSPIAPYAPDDYKKIRIQTNTFDLISNPLTGEASIGCNFDENTRVHIKDLKKFLQFMEIILDPKKSSYLELTLNNTPKIKLNISSDSSQPFYYTSSLKAANHTLDLLTEFDITEDVYTSPIELDTCAHNIAGLYKITKADATQFKIEFKGGKYEINLDNEISVIHLISAPIGSLTIGAFVSFTGHATLDSSGLYTLLPSTVKIERKITSNSNTPLDLDAFNSVKNQIEESLSHPQKTLIFIDPNTTTMTEST